MLHLARGKKITDKTAAQLQFNFFTHISVSHSSGVIWN